MTATGGNRRDQVRRVMEVAVGDGASADELLRDADRAMYEAKRTGRDRAVVFTEDLRGTGR